MAKKIFCLFLCLSLLLCGCVYRSTVDDLPTVVVYRLSDEKSGGRLVREKLLYEEGREPIEAVMEALNSPAAQIGLSKAFPGDVEINSVSLENGVATVDMNGEYIRLTSRQRLLAESAVVLSFSTLSEVCSVNMSCCGMDLAGGLTCESISEADGLCGGYERTLKLYLPDEGRGGLSPVSVEVFDDGSLGSAEMVVTELLEALGNGMEDTRLLSVDIEDGLCRLDLSEEFYGAEPTERFEGMLLVYSIVNSLCRLNGIDEVAVSVEGYAVESYGGFATRWPLKSNENIVTY